MRSRSAVYVDAGYLLAASATRIAGTSLRSGIEADHEGLVQILITYAEEKSGLPLLRVHWYDAAHNGVPDESQQKIGLLPRVKLRLGRIGFDGEQKGVDLRIGLDLVAHARNAAIEVVYLVSGDDDLTEAVEEAQAHGVQVIILAVPGKSGDPHGVSRHLQGAADGLDLIATDALDNAITPRTVVVSKPSIDPKRDCIPTERSASIPSPTLLADREPSSLPVPASTPTFTSELSPLVTSGLVYSSSTGGGSVLRPDHADDERLDKAVADVVHRVLRAWLDGHTAEHRAQLIASRPSIPRDVDRALLLDLSEVLGIYDLSDTVRHKLRARFWAELSEEM